MAEYLDYEGLEYYHGKLKTKLENELADKQDQLDAHSMSINSLANGKVDKVVGKQLSSNDFTDAYKAILDGGIGGDYVPYEHLDGQSIDLNTLILGVSDPPRKIYFLPQFSTLVSNTPFGSENGAFMLEVSKTSQLRVQGIVTIVQRLYYYPSMGLSRGSDVIGFYTRSLCWRESSSPQDLEWTPLVRDDHAVTAEDSDRADSVKQSYISGSDHDYPILASGDYSLTQNDVTGTPYKMHGLKYNPQKNTLTAGTFKGDLNGTASNASYAASAGAAASADSASSADSVKQSYISGANHDYPILASGDYSKTIGDITGTPYKMHGATFNPKTGVLTASKIDAEVINHNLRPITYGTSSVGSTLTTGSIYLQYES